MTSSLPNAEFSFTFSLIIGSSFSFNLCPSDLLLLLQPWGCKTTSLYFFVICIWSPSTSWLKILFLIISDCFCCGFLWLFCYKIEENIVESICMARTVFYNNTSLYYQRCITGDFLSCLAYYSSQSWNFRSVCFHGSVMGRRIFGYLDIWIFVKSIKRTMKSKT